MGLSLLQGHSSEVGTSCHSCRKVKRGCALAWGHIRDLLIGKALDLLMRTPLGSPA